MVEKNGQKTGEKVHGHEVGRSALVGISTYGGSEKRNRPLSVLVGWSALVGHRCLVVSENCFVMQRAT